MNISDWLRLVAALSVAVANSILPTHAGFGAVGAWILGTIFSTLLFSSAGGVHRMRFTAIAVLPPFFVNRATEICANWAIYRNTRSPSEALVAMFPETLLVSLLA